MKKLNITMLSVFCILLVVLAAIITKSTGVTTSTPELSNNSGNEIDSAVSDISEALHDYYYAKDISGEFEADPYFENDIASYLADKVKTEQHLIKIHDTDKENYNIDVNLIDAVTETGSDIIAFEFQAFTTFNYVGRDFDTTISDVVNVSYDAKRHKIVDVFIPLDYYDEHVRNGAGDTASSGSGNNDEFKLTSKIISKQEELHYDIGLW